MPRKTTLKKFGSLGNIKYRSHSVVGRAGLVDETILMAIVMDDLVTLSEGVDHEVVDKVLEDLVTYATADPQGTTNPLVIAYQNSLQLVLSLREQIEQVGSVDLAALWRAEDERDRSMIQIGRLRAACRSVLREVEKGKISRATISFLKEVVQ